MIIDAKDLIMGRLAAQVAKKLLEGEKISITGSRNHILDHYRQRRARGHPYHGPHFPRMPDRILRRAVRGMLPYKRKRGRDAFHRLKVFIGKPQALKDVESQTIPGINLASSNTGKFMRLGDISRELGISRDRWES